MKHQSWNKAKRWLAWLGGGVIVVCLVLAGFWYWINIPPQVDIPTPKMPHPNGFDYFRRAGAAYIKDTKGVDESTDDSIITKDKKYPLAAKEAWLKKNAKAFHLLREGLKYPAMHKRVSSASYPEYAQYRKLARALAVESHARAERGDWGGAMQSALDGYHFGSKIARGGPLISGMVSVAIRAISLRELGNLIPHSNATTAKMAAASMEKYYERRYPYYKTLQDQKWEVIAEYSRIMREPSWRIDVMHSLNHPILRTVGLEPGPFPSTIEKARILFISKRQLTADLTSFMNALIRNARQPYIRQAVIPDTDNPLVSDMRPVYERTRWNWARINTYSVEVMTMYALRAYKIDNGHYPKTLKTLMPMYLHKVPLDPYSGISPIQYRLDGKKYRLWSIGPDGVNDQGMPIVNQDKPETARYRFLYPDSKGDVVAGVNTP